PRRDLPTPRENELQVAHDEEWRMQVPENFRARTWYERGFLGSVRCGVQEFVEEMGSALWKAAPVTMLDLYEPNGSSGDPDYSPRFLEKALAAFVGVPELVHVHTLSFCESAMRGRHVKTMLASPYLSGMRVLYLQINNLGDSGARAVAEAGRSAGLEL